LVTILAGKLKLTLRLDKGTVLASVREHTYRHHDPAITKPASIQRISLKPATAAAGSLSVMSRSWTEGVCLSL